MQVTPDPELVSRFRDDVGALTGAPPTPEARLGLAVSGGPDSLALLLLAAAAFPDTVAAATVDHGLRPEAADEAAMVARTCAELAVPHTTLHVTPGATGNLQERARTARYAALGEWARRSGVPWIAVAHQRDDLAETFLMRAGRGSGIGGLAAMRSQRPIDGAVLVRPLLDWPRCQLAAIARDAGFTPASDPSNRDPRFDRSRIRALIAATPDLRASRLATAARNLRHAEDALDWAFRRELPDRFQLEGREASLAPADLPYELRRRLVRHAVQQVRAAAGLTAPWREQGLDRLVATLLSGGIGTIAGVQALAKHGKWHFRLAPPRRSG